MVRRLRPLVRVCQNQLALLPGYASEEYTTLVYLFAKELFISIPRMITDLNFIPLLL